MVTNPAWENFPFTLFGSQGNLGNLDIWQECVLQSTDNTHFLRFRECVDTDLPSINIDQENPSEM